MNQYSPKLSPNIGESFTNRLLHENYKRDDKVLPFRVHYIDNSSGGIFIHKHWHEEFEILHVFSGMMQVSVAEHTFAAQTGDTIVIPANALHTAHKIESTACNFTAIVFDIKFISGNTHDLIHTKYFSPLLDSPSKHVYWIRNKSTLNKKFHKSVKNIIKCFDQKTVGYELLIKASILTFFAELYKHKEEISNFHTDETTDCYNSSYICKKIILYVKENIEQKITLDEVAEHIGFSKGYFCRYFKKHFRTSFFTYLNQERVANAKFLLKHTNLKIIDIAVTTGFDDANYFSIVFKRVAGCTPSEYRFRTRKKHA